MLGALVVFAFAVGCSGQDDGQVAGDEETEPFAEVPDAGDTSAGTFLERNGWMWFYTTADEITYDEITAMLDDLHDGGVRVIGIYSPYDGDVDKWLGCMPRDYYATPPQSGTLDDFTAMVDAAHARDIKVVTYFSILAIDHESEFFRTAEEQYAAGDRTSREVSAFHWADHDEGELPTPAPGPSAWAYSTVADAYYWQLWGAAGFDLDLPGARAEVVRAEEFWLATGIDGFMWDAGVPEPELAPVMVDLPAAYSDRDMWLTFEVTYAEEAEIYTDFGLTSWFNFEDNDEDNDYSLVVEGRATTDELEESLGIAEEANADGKLTHAWSPFESGRYAHDRMLVQEAALLAGGGVGYGAGSYTEFLDWPADVRADWHQVLATVNDHPALLPSATRTRVPTGGDPQTYAMHATAADGSESALLIYNLSGQPATVPVDLAGTDISVGQTPVDLYAGAPAAPIAATAHPVELPAYGFALLGVTTDDG